MDEKEATNGKEANSREVRSELHQYGFQYGAADVMRLCSDERSGLVVIGITTPKTSLQVYVTKTGKARVMSNNGEWSQPKPRRKGR